MVRSWTSCIHVWPGTMPTITPRHILTFSSCAVMNGLDCLRSIVADPLLSEIPVVILLPESSYDERARVFGAAGFVRKQTGISSLRDELEQVLLKTSTVAKYSAMKTRKNSKRKTLLKFPAKKNETELIEGKERQQREAVMHVDGFRRST